MRITFAATSAYDPNEVYLFLTTEEGESINVGDVLDVPMIDYSFVKKEIISFIPNKKKGIAPTKIANGECGRAIIHNIHSGWIKTESNVYIDADMTGVVCFGEELYGYENKNT